MRTPQEPLSRASNPSQQGQTDHALPKPDISCASDTRGRGVALRWRAMLIGRRPLRRDLKRLVVGPGEVAEWSIAPHLEMWSTWKRTGGFESLLSASAQS